MRKLKFEALPDKYFEDNLNGEVRTPANKNHREVMDESMNSTAIFGENDSNDIMSVERSAARDNYRGYIRLAKPIIREFIGGINGTLIAKILGISKEQHNKIINFECYYNVTKEEFIEINEAIAVSENDRLLMYAEIYKYLISKFDIEKTIESIILESAKKKSRAKEPMFGVTRNPKEGLWVIGDYYLYSENKRITDNWLMKIRNDLAEQTSSRLGRLFILLNLDKKDLERCITGYISVVPYSMRPKVEREDALTIKYGDVIGANTRLRERLANNSSLSEIKVEYEKLVQNCRELLTESDPKKPNYQSIQDKLAGKYGFIRDKMIGKRADYTGRSVVTANPELKIDEVALPVDMIPALYKHHHMKKLGSISAINSLSKKSNEELTKEIMELGILDEVYANINRAPTLHSLSYMSYKVKVSKSKSIEVNPLVCEGFNMDFDGDTAAVNIPITPEGIRDTNTVMLSTNNLYKPATGECTVKPRLEMIYGLNICTKKSYLEVEVGTHVASEEEYKQRIAFGEITPSNRVTRNSDGSMTIYKNNLDNFSSYEELEKSVLNGDVKLWKHCNVSGLGRGPAGHLLVKGALPESLRNELPEITKKSINGIVDKLLLMGVETFKESIHKLCQIGFKIATLYPPTISILKDIDRETLHKPINKFHDEVKELTTLYEDGFEEENKYNLNFSEAFSNAEKEIRESILSTLGEHNGFKKLVESGARGDDNNLLQIYSHKGRIARVDGSAFNAVIENSFTTQLNPLEHFISAYGSRKGIIEKSIKPGETGYAERQMWHTAGDIHIVEKDCGTSEGFLVRRSDILNLLQNAGTTDKEELHVKSLEIVAKLIEGRYLAKSNQFSSRKFKDMLNKVNIDDFPINKKAAKELAESEEKIIIRSPLKCKNLCCSKCYGTDLATRRPAVIGTPVGMLAAQSIGEPGTQLTMKSFQKGGVAGRGDVGTDFEIVNNVLTLVNIKGKDYYDPIAWISGKVVEVYRSGENTRKRIMIEYDEELSKDYNPNDDRFKLKSSSIPANVEVKKVAVLGEPLSVDKGHIDIKDLFDICGLDAAQKHIVYTCYMAYFKNSAVNMIHFETMVSAMSMLHVLKSDNPNYIVGQQYTRTEFNKRRKPNQDVVVVDHLSGINTVPLYRASAVDTMNMEHIVTGIAGNILVKRDDELESPFAALMFGLKPKIGSYYEDFIKNRTEEAMNRK